LDQKASGLSKQRSLNKNQLQELLLGVGLCLRDHQLSNFADPDTPLPDFLINSKMTIEDGESITRILQLLSDAIHHDSGFVSC
jgi:hypothetical protein